MTHPAPSAGKLQAASTISVVDQVTVPTMMLIGLGDKRVPPSQVLQK